MFNGRVLNYFLSLKVGTSVAEALVGFFFFLFLQLTFFYICKSGTHFQWINAEWWNGEA